MNEAAKWLLSLAETSPLAYAYDEPVRKGAVLRLRTALEGGDVRQIQAAFTGLGDLFDAMTCKELQGAMWDVTGKLGTIRSAAVRRYDRRASLREGLRGLGL